jgi:putative PIN family toxin of toxin-antitoxin system
MKLVLDTDVLIAGLRSPTGASAELLRMARRKLFTPVVSVPLVLEYEAVATLPDHLGASGLSCHEVQAVIDVLVGVSEWTRVYYLYRPSTNDPADEMVLEAAMNSGADAIVTFNRRHFADAAATFRIGCWLPREALEKMR